METDSSCSVSLGPVPPRPPRPALFDGAVLCGLTAGPPIVKSSSKWQVVFDNKDSLVPRVRDCSRSDGEEWHVLAKLQSLGLEKAQSGPAGTFTCMECGCTLSGYFDGDPHMAEHVLIGGGKCSYVRDRFKNRGRELLLLLGRCRFRRGYVGLPEYIFLADDTGAVLVENVRCCVVCCKESVESFSEVHRERDGDWQLCHTLMSNVKRYLLETQLCTFDRQLLPLDPALFGPPANLVRLGPDSPFYSCQDCGVKLYNFVSGDSFMNEHVYWVHERGLNCGFLDQFYKTCPQSRDLVIAKRRASKGFAAFPNKFFIRQCWGAHLPMVGSRGYDCFCAVCGGSLGKGMDGVANFHTSECKALKKKLSAVFTATCFVK